MVRRSGIITIIIRETARAHRRLTLALEQNSYSDAHEMLKDFEKWLRAI